MWGYNRSVKHSLCCFEAYNLMGGRKLTYLSDRLRGQLIVKLNALSSTWGTADADGI